MLMFTVRLNFANVDVFGSYKSGEVGQLAAVLVAAVLPGAAPVPGPHHAAGLHAAAVEEVERRGRH